MGSLLHCIFWFYAIRGVYIIPSQWWRPCQYRRCIYGSPFRICQLLGSSLEKGKLILTVMGSSSIYLGRTQSVVCPVVSLLQFPIIRPSYSGLRFIWQDGSPLTQQQFTHEVRMMLQLAGLCSSSYAGHSFHVGAATMAAQAGLPSHLIKMLGRWESDA